MEKGYRLDLSGVPKELFDLLDFINTATNGETVSRTVQTDAVDWDHVLRLAGHHRIYPLLYDSIRKSNAAGIPVLAVQALKRDYQVSTLRMLAMSAEMESLSVHFAMANIRSIYLKGPVLAHDLYGDVSLRTSGDLDVLIPIGDLPSAERLLSGFGYVKDEYFDSLLNDWKWRHHHFTYCHYQKGIKLEIHWRLGPGPGKEPSFQELWERKRISLLTTNPVYYLGREDLFLFLLSHGARHGWSRLRWLYDIDRLLAQRMNYPVLLALLKKYEQAQVAGQAVLLCAELLNSPVPPELRRVQADKRAGRLAQAALFYLRDMIDLHGDEPLPTEVARYHKRHLFSLMSVRRRLLFLLSFLYPYPEDTELLELPKSLHFLYFPLRPLLWLWRKSRKQVLLGGGKS